jgi:hypothetical protein
LIPFHLSFFFRTRVSYFFSIGFTIPLPFFFCRIEVFGRDCSSTTSLGDDDILKGFLTLVLAAGGNEEKCSFFLFFVAVLVVE